MSLTVFRSLPCLLSGSLALAIAASSSAQSQCSTDNLLGDPEFGPGTTLGFYGNTSVEDQWLQENAIVVSGPSGCVVPTTPSSAGMLHLMQAGASASQVRQVVSLPGGAAVVGDYVIATARFNAPTANASAAIAIRDAVTQVPIPGGVVSRVLDDDCGTWEELVICAPIPPGMTRLNIDLIFTNSTIPQGGFVDDASLTVHTLVDALTAPDFGPGTTLGNYVSSGIEDQWLEEQAVVAAGPVGCVMPTTPGTPGMLHFMETGGFSSQVRQVISLPAGPASAGDYVIATARFNSPSSASVGAIAIRDAVTQVPIPGGVVSMMLDDDCGTWEEMMLCIPIPAGMDRLNIDLIFTNGTIPEGGFIDEAHLYVCGCGSVPIGIQYCPTALNSTNQPGLLTATGSRVVSLNCVTLHAAQLPSNAFGFFINSQTQGFIMNPGGSSGNLCLSGAIGRYVGPGQIQSSGALGEFDLSIDLTAVPTPTGPAAVTAGQTWNFQAWHRDSSMGAATSNFTNGLSIDFL